MMCYFWGWLTGLTGFKMGDVIASGLFLGGLTGAPYHNAPELVKNLLEVPIDAPTDFWALFNWEALMFLFCFFNQKESRTNRVDSWRSFQAGGKKKKKEKKGRTAFKPPALRPEKR